MAAKLSEVFPLSRRSPNRRKKRPSAPRIDYGTPELVAKRRAIVGVSVKRDSSGQPRIEPNDPTKAYSPAAAMLARGLINQDQFSAAERYSWLYARALGARTPAAESYPALVGPGCCGAVPACKDCTPAKIEAKWRDAVNALGRHPRKVKDAVENVAIFWRWPRWFVELTGRRNTPRPTDEGGYQALLAGLDALVEIGCTVQERKAA